MCKKITNEVNKLCDVVLPPPKFNQFDPVLYNGIRTEIADSANYYAFNGWQYSYTKEKAENTMVYKVVPVTGALEVKLDLDIQLKTN